MVCWCLQTGATPLHVAVWMGVTNVVSALKSAGSDVLAVDKVPSLTIALQARALSQRSLPFVSAVLTISTLFALLTAFAVLTVFSVLAVLTLPTSLGVHGLSLLCVLCFQAGRSIRTAAAESPALPPVEQARLVRHASYAELGQRRRVRGDSIARVVEVTALVPAPAWSEQALRDILAAASDVVRHVTACVSVCLCVCVLLCLCVCVCVCDGVCVLLLDMGRGGMVRVVGKRCAV